MRAAESAMGAINDSVGKFCQDVQTRRKRSVHREQKEQKKHERQQSPSSSRRKRLSNCISCRSYSSKRGFFLLVHLSVQHFPTESSIAASANYWPHGRSTIFRLMC